MKTIYLALIAFLAIFVTPLAHAQVQVQTSTWYDCKGTVNIGVLTPPKVLENFLGTKYSVNFSAYTGANNSGIPGAGFMFSGPIDLWKGGGITLGLAGGWDQGQKLKGKVIVGFYLKQ